MALSGRLLEFRLAFRRMRLVQDPKNLGIEDQEYRRDFTILRYKELQAAAALLSPQERAQAWLHTSIDSIYGRR